MITETAGIPLDFRRQFPAVGLHQRAALAEPELNADTLDANLPRYFTRNRRRTACSLG